MKLISHRGNINGPMESWENEPTYIDKAIQKGYDVEVDVWFKDKILFLGHDNPQYGVNMDWFHERRKNLWIHCKNIQTIEWFSFLNSNINTDSKLNFFWHESDTLTLTSKGYIWVYPGSQPIKNSIAVMPEIHNDDVSQCIGVCSNYIKRYEK